MAKQKNMEIAIYWFICFAALQVTSNRFLPDTPVQVWSILLSPRGVCLGGGPKDINHHQSMPLMEGCGCHISGKPRMSNSKNSLGGHFIRDSNVTKC